MSTFINSNHRVLASGLLLALTASAEIRASDFVSKPYPYELAFKKTEFRRYESPVVSSDGQKVAYTVVTAPEVVQQGGRSLPNGTPLGAVGAKVYLAQVGESAGQGARICGSAGNQWEPTWSPDGQYVGLFSDADGQPNFWVYSASDRTCRKVSDKIIRASDFYGYRTQWSPDGRTVYVPVRPDPALEVSDATDPRTPAHRAKKPGEREPAIVFKSGSEISEDETPVNPIFGKDRPFLLAYYNATWTAIDVASGSARSLLDARAEPRPATARVSPSGKWLSMSSVIYQSQDNTKTLKDLSLVPTNGGTSLPVANGLVMSNAAVNYAELDYHWHPREDRVIFLRDEQLWSVDATAEKVGQPQQIASSLGPLIAPVAYFTPDGNAVLTGIDPEGEGRLRKPSALALIPLSGGVPKRLLLPDKRQWQFIDVVRANDSMIWQAEPRFVHVVMRDRSTAENAIFRIDVSGGPAVSLASGLVQYRNFASNGDHATLSAVFEDASTAPDIYTLDKDMKRQHRVSRVEPASEAYPLGRAEVIETQIPVYDGSLQKVRTTLLLPPGAKRGDKLPAVVMIYSGSDLSTQATFYGGGSGNTVPNLVFTSRGYAVIMANIVLSPEDKPGNPLGDMVDALLPQVHALASMGYVDLERLAVSGQSYGGYSTAAIVSQTNLFRAGIAVNGLYDIGSHYGSLDEQGASTTIRWAESVQGRMGETPWDNPLRYINNSPYYRLDRIQTPLLIIAGEQDKTVSPSQSKMLFVGLRRLDRPSQIAIYPGEGHSIGGWSIAGAADAANRMIEFLDDHLRVTHH